MSKQLLKKFTRAQHEIYVGFHNLNFSYQLDTNLFIYLDNM